jgi:primase-polymerase (primpol)-like protein
VLWRLGEDRGGGKRPKIPFQPHHPHRHARPNDPSTWSTFDLALEILLMPCWPPSIAFDGLGFVFRPQDPYFGCDLDHCLLAGGLMSWATYIDGGLAGTYNETSPSGHGIKFIGRVELSAQKGPTLSA